MKGFRLEKSMADTASAREGIEELRAVMGTLPSQSPELKTEFVRGVEGIKVELIDRPVNPYKSMYVMATSCWGDKINKWAETSPKYRFEVVKAVLNRQALPLALESSSFVFAIEGPSRACFDQLARTRIGAVFSAKGMRDNNWKGASIRIPNALWPTDQEIERSKNLGFEDPSTFTEVDKNLLQKVTLFYEIIQGMSDVKELYASIVDRGKSSWQAARTVLPLYVCYGYSVAYNFSSLLGVCSNRMKFCEMEDTVAVAWLMQDAVKNVFPLLASFLRPGCDLNRKCQYHKAYSMSEMFGCLFKECGRNPCMDSNEYAEFNETCTSKELLESQLGLSIPTPEDWVTYTTYESLDPKDKVLFEQD